MNVLGFEESGNADELLLFRAAGFGELTEFTAFEDDPIEVRERGDGLVRELLRQGI